MDKKYNFTIASIESFTGGLFASTIINRPGASRYFKGSLVTYWNEVKEKLGVDTSGGVINSKVALDMAKRGKEFFNVDYCIAFTGNAGPLAMENKEVGLIYVAINSNVYEIKFNNMNRNQIRQAAVKFAIDKLNQMLETNF